MLQKIFKKIGKAIYFFFSDFSEFRRRLVVFINPIRLSIGRVIRKIAYHLTVASEKYNTRSDQLIGDEDVLKLFLERCKKMDKPRVLELGTKRSIPDRPTIHKDLIPNAGEYLGSDIEPGEDVHIVADAHRLTKYVGEKQFDVIFSSATFEHLKYPHLAAHELMKALKIGGVLYIETHQTFPVHAYPFDYFRFSREAMAGLFGTKMGFRVISTGYKYPLSIYSSVSTDRDCPAFILVQLYAEKISETPDEYIYEYDCNL